MTKLIRWTLWERMQRSDRQHRRLFGFGLDRDFFVAVLLAAGLLVIWWFAMGPDRMGR